VDRVASTHFVVSTVAVGDITKQQLLSHRSCATSHTRT
jgi:hypothetical protein